MSKKPWLLTIQDHLSCWSTPLSRVCSPDRQILLSTSLVKGLLDLVQVFNSSLVESISNAGRNIPRQVLNGPLQVDTNCLAPEFDYDFTSVCDHRQTFRRGDQPYERPCGSYRIALKVENQFGADNAWLGVTGDNPEEWPVSYHGTGQHNALSIAEEGSKLCNGKRFLYGKGIYSTPELSVAKPYATSFKHEGIWYKCLIQNRVNPKHLKVIPKERYGLDTYWLSEVTQGMVESEVIRPYGLCLFKQQSACLFMWTFFYKRK